MTIRFTLLAFAASLLTSVALASPAPVVGITSLSEMATPPARPYDPTANAKVQLADAQARARRSGKRLLIDLGGNWCPDCRILAGFMARSEVAAFVAAHYEVVMIDVGHMDRNLDIPRRYGVNNLVGVPSVLIVDRKGRLVDAGHTAALSDARSMTPQALAEWLARWTN